jgi:hypothetical protein
MTGPPFEFVGRGLRHIERKTDKAEPIIEEGKVDSAHIAMLFCRAQREELTIRYEVF